MSKTGSFAWQHSLLVALRTFNKDRTCKIASVAFYEMPAKVGNSKRLKITENE